ncbi:MAG: hypothetical protein FADNKDHG_01314 [Holosporales bacterium]
MIKLNIPKKMSLMCVLGMTMLHGSDVHSASTCQSYGVVTITTNPNLEEKKLQTECENKTTDIFKIDDDLIRICFDDDLPIFVVLPEGWTVNGSTSVFLDPGNYTVFAEKTRNPK